MTFNTSEMLMMKGTKKNYAIGFSFVAEICFGVKLSKIPCLPESFLGVFNYKGTVIPVIELEKGCSEGESKSIILILKCGKHRLGMFVGDQPDIIPSGAAQQIQEEVAAEEGAIWMEKEICRYGEHLISVIDLERSVEAMILGG